MKKFMNLMRFLGLKSTSKIRSDNRRTADVGRLLALIIPTLLLPTAVGETPGVSDDTLIIGNTMPYTGPASAFGTIGRAAAAYFDKINADGGVNGRRIEMISLDDGYNPARTKQQVRRLVERDRVLLLFAPLGTPTNIAIHRYINEQQVPHLFVFSGSSRWDQPEHFPWTLGFIPSNRTEGAAFARYVVSALDAPRIAILYPNNDIGDDYLSGIRAALGTDAEQLIVASESVEATDPSVSTQMVALKASGANVLINLALPKFAAQAIKQTGALDWQPLHIVASASSSIAGVLRPAGVDNAAGMVSVKYHKDPNSPRWADDPKMIAWRQWMRDFYPDGDPTSNFNVSGYSAAQTLVEVLRRAGDDVSRDNLMRVATNLQNVELDLLLPGIVLNTGADDYRAIETLQMVRFDGAAWVPFGDLIDAGGR